MASNVLKYVLITPARNEEGFIEQTLQSVINQTVLPIKWVIASDGSTDGTDTIVSTYADSFPWISLLQMPKRKERHFGGKALAFNAGYEKVSNLEYSFIGSLDADISFAPDYFEYLLGKFIIDTTLGVAGTPFRENNVQYDYRFSRKDHVSGACQLFRRECFESIGGYAPLKAGGVDLYAVITARMRGWRTETFLDRYSIHHRHMGSAKDRIISAAFKGGYSDYQMGVHPLWQFIRSIYQMSRKPILVWGCVLLAGYIWAMIRHTPKPVSIEFVEFRRKEQIAWLKKYFKISRHFHVHR